MHGESNRSNPPTSLVSTESGPGGLLDAIAEPLGRLSTSRFNLCAGLISDSSISIALLGGGFMLRGPVPEAAVTVACGLFAFSLVEYGIHRWLFHGRSGPFEAGHRRHHEQPLGYDALPFFLPPLAMAALAGLLALVMPAYAALLLAGSVALGYAAYGLSHVAIHAFRFRNPLLRRWAAAHHVHHCHPERNFGVTSPLWDMLLGTRYLSASRRLAR
jgi:4-hydroxysphinganine ceramide fatty acyl 2-hydroxylase